MKPAKRAFSCRPIGRFRVLRKATIRRKKPRLRHGQAECLRPMGEGEASRCEASVASASFRGHAGPCCHSCVVAKDMLQYTHPHINRQGVTADVHYDDIGVGMQGQAD